MASVDNKTVTQEMAEQRAALRQGPVTLRECIAAVTDDSLRSTPAWRRLLRGALALPAGEWYVVEARNYDDTTISFWDGRLDWSAMIAPNANRNPASAVRFVSERDALIVLNYLQRAAINGGATHFRLIVTAQRQA